MGTTLTGTTPQDTYDSLIKVTDNGPLSGTAKYLSDGLGNDSVLAVSTSRIGIGSTIDSGELITAYGASEAAIVFQNTNSGTGSGQGLYLGTLNAENYLWTYENQPLIVATNNTERMRILADGNVGIGTSSPTEPLHVSGDARVTNLGVNFAAQADARIFAYDNSANSSLVIQQDNASGIIAKFNGSGGATKVRIDADGLKFGADTAAANALDDYEEGTFTATLTPTTSGSITLNASYTSFFYTKIGRQVMVSGTAIVTSVSSPVGFVRLEGLPFTSNSATSNLQAVNIQYYDNSATSFIFAAAYMSSGVSRITTSIDASTVAAGDEIYFTHTYNV